MKPEDIKNTFDKLEPDERAKERMLSQVLHAKGKRKGVGWMNRWNNRVIIPALTLIFVLVGGFLVYDLMKDDPADFVSNKGRSSETDTAGRLPEDNIAEVKNQFQLGDRHYILLREEQREDFGLPKDIQDNDIGDKMTTITTSVDDDLIGREVFEYIPAGGEAVVAVKKDNELELYKFLAFESYNNNKDEDARAYLEIFGIKSSEDLQKIQFIGHSEAAKIEGRMDVLSEITDRENVKKFYDFYSVIKDSSSEYFDALYNYRATIQPENNEPNQPVAPDEAPDKPVTDLPQGVGTKEPAANIAEDLPATDSNAADTPMRDLTPAPVYDFGDDEGSEGVSEPGSPGMIGNPLGDSVTIRVYNPNGVYYETVYYPNIKFISRHKVNEEFSKFLEEYIK